jgi:hypothetical protein
VEIRRHLHGPGHNSAEIIEGPEKLCRCRVERGHRRRGVEPGAPLETGDRVPERDSRSLRRQRLGRQRPWGHHASGATTVRHQRHHRNEQAAVQGQLRGDAAPLLLPDPVAQVAALLRAGHQQRHHEDAQRELRHPRVEQVQHSGKHSSRLAPTVWSLGQQVLSQHLLQLWLCVLDFRLLEMVLETDEQ